MQSNYWSRPALCLVLCAFAAAAPVNSAPPTYGYEIVHAYPHDRNAFTQGLIYLNGFLYEGTGLNGRSSLRKVKLETGVDKLRELPR